MADDITVHLLKHAGFRFALHLKRVVHLLGSDGRSMFRQAGHVLKKDNGSLDIFLFSDHFHGTVAGDDADLQLFFYFAHIRILHSENISLDFSAEIQFFFHIAPL